MPYHFLQSVVTKITGAVIVACSAYFYINGTMSAVYAIGMTISAFMLYSSLECAGNYSSLLHVVSVCVDKANAILELDTMDIDGKERIMRKIHENGDMYGKMQNYKELALAIAARYDDEAYRRILAVEKGTAVKPKGGTNR